MVFRESRHRSWLRAFTLVELLSVIAIIAVLASVVIGAGRRTSEVGQLARAKSELASLAAALESYAQRYGNYPQTEESTVLLQALAGRRGPTGKVIADKPLIDLAQFTTSAVFDPLVRTDVELLDPWGMPYRYFYTAATTSRAAAFLLFSNGPDGESTPPNSIGFLDESLPQNGDNVVANR